MGHHPARIGWTCNDIKQLQERRDERVVKIHHHNHFVTRTAGIFSGGGRVSNLTFAILGGAGCSGEARESRLSGRYPIQELRAAGANRHLQIARFRLGGAIVNHQASPIAIGDIVNGGDAGLILHGAFLRLALRKINIGRLASACPIPVEVISTISRVVFAGDSVAHGLAGHILDQQPGGEQKREINNGEQQHQKDRHRQRKLDHALRTAGPLPKPFSIRGKRTPASFHDHAPNAPTG